MTIVTATVQGVLFSWLILGRVDLVGNDAARGVRPLGYIAETKHFVMVNETKPSTRAETILPVLNCLKSVDVTLVYTVLLIVVVMTFMTVI